MILNSRRPRGLLNARMLTVAAVLFLFIASGANATTATTTAAAPQSLPGQAQLQAAPTQNSSMTLAAVFSRASYGNPELSYNTIAVEQADLDMLLSTNVKCIRIDIGYAPWLQNNQAVIDEITSLVKAIKAAGRCLIVADAASETYRKGGQLPWSQFMVAWGQRVSTIAASYQPDYYIVVKEPGWYVPMVSDATTNPRFQNVSVWLSLTQNLTNAVHSASPSTVVGVAIAANSLTQAEGAFYSEYLNRAQAIAGISFVGFDIYSQNDQKATQTYLSQNPPSKAVWIPEAWSTANGSAINGSPSQDAEWMLSMYRFASSIDAAFLIPFYSDNFASYTLVADHPTDSAQIISLYQQRTPIFSAFQSLAATGTSSVTATQSAAGTNTTATSLPTTHTSDIGTGTGRNNTSILRGVILAAIVLIVLGGAFFYFMRRKR